MFDYGARHELKRVIKWRVDIKFDFQFILVAPEFILVTNMLEGTRGTKTETEYIQHGPAQFSRFETMCIRGIGILTPFKATEFLVAKRTFGVI